MSLTLVLLYLLSLIVIIFYTLFIGLYTIGWYLTKKSIFLNTDYSTKISVILQMDKNEINIIDTLKIIYKQDYPSHLYEIIIAVDNISDELKEKTNLFINKTNDIDIKIIDNNKANISNQTVLEFAFSSSKNDLIIITNNESEMSYKWLSSMIDLYEKEKPSLILGPIMQKRDKGIINKIISLYKMFKFGIGAGSIRMNNGIYVDKANLMFEKILCRNNINEKRYSTDPNFIFLKAKSLNKKIIFNNNREAILYSKPNYSIKELLLQNMKLVSENFKYFDFSIYSMRVIIFLYSALFITWGVGMIIELWLIRLFLVLLISKIIIDLPIYIGIAHYTKKKHLLLYYFPLQILMPFFEFIVFIGSIFLKKSKSNI